MKRTALVALLLVSMGAVAQTNSTTASGTALGNLQGNNQGVNQAVTFDSPANVTSNINYSGTQTIKNVPSVNGPNLTTSNDTCMGSSSAGANGPGIGLSFGTTWTDEQCKRLKMSRELWNKGMKAASLAMDCMDPAARAALEMTGTRCPQSMTPEERVSTFGPAPQQVSVAAPPAPPAPPASLASAAPAAPLAAAPAVPPAPLPQAVPPTAPAGQPAATTAAPPSRASASMSASASSRPRYAQRSSSVMPLEEAVLTPMRPRAADADGSTPQQVAALSGVRP